MNLAKRLREKAIGIRLDAYYETGGIGAKMLRAERKAEELEKQALDAEKPAEPQLRDPAGSL